MYLFYIFRLLKDVSTSKAQNNLGPKNSQKLILPDGIPESVSDLAEFIKKQCEIEGSFRLQYMDADFRNEFTNLDLVSDVLDKSTLSNLQFRNPSPA